MYKKKKNVVHKYSDTNCRRAQKIGMTRPKNMKPKMAKGLRNPAVPSVFRSHSHALFKTEQVHQNQYTVMYQTHQRKEHAILGAAFPGPHTDLHQDMNKAAQNTLSVTNITFQINLQSQISAGVFIREDSVFNLDSQAAVESIISLTATLNN